MKMTVDLKEHSYPIYIESGRKNSGSISGIKDHDHFR